MSESDTFPCPSCDATYRRGSLSEGQRVKCRKCGAIITVPGDEFEALEDLIEAPEDAPDESAAPTRRSAARGRASAGKGGRASTSRGAARGGSKRGSAKRSSSRERPGQSDRDKKAPTMLFVSIGAMVAIAAGVWFLTKSGDGDKSGDKPGVQAGTNASSDGSASSNKDSSANKKTAKAKEPTKRERFDAAVAAAEASSDESVKVAKFLEAIELRDSGGLDDVATSVDALREKILEVDPDHKATRLALGFIQYTGGHPDWKDKWVTRDKYGEITDEWEARKKAEAASLAKKKEAERWTTPFGKKAKRVADYFRKEAAKVPDLKLKFYFDSADTPKPYLLMVEDVQTPAPDEVARDIGPGLAALRKQFRRAYPNKMLPNWDDTEYVVPVLVLADEKSYDRYRENGHNFFPSTEVVAAFYVSAVDESVEDVCKGALYVWRHSEKSEAEFYQSLFHEGTHQIMHNAAAEVAGRPMMPRKMPWMTEGMAEFWGSYEGNRHAGYKFRRLLDGRYPTLQRCAIAYQKWRASHRKWVAGGEEGDPPAKTGFMTPKDFLGVTRLRFDQARRRQGDKKASQEDSFIVSSAYALGWAWIYYCHVGVRASKVGKSKREFVRGFEKTLADELRHKSSMKKLEEHYGIDDQATWDAITKDFYFFVQRTLRKYKSGALDLPDIPFPTK